MRRAPHAADRLQLGIPQPLPGATPHKAAFIFRAIGPPPSPAASPQPHSLQVVYLERLISLPLLHQHPRSRPKWNQAAAALRATQASAAAPFSSPEAPPA